MNDGGILAGGLGLTSNETFREDVQNGFSGRRRKRRYRRR